MSKEMNIDEEEKVEPEEDVEIGIEKELEQLKHELERVGKKSTESQTVASQPTKLRIEEREKTLVFPEWVEKSPWMYVKPNRKEHIESWREEWSKLLLDYGRQKELFGVDINELARTYPFAKLSVEYLREIIEDAVSKGLAEWADAEKKFVKLRWRTIAGWGRKLFQMGVKEGYPRYDMFQLIDTFGMFPEDVQAIFDYMVKNNLARYVGTTKKVIELII
ncbi:MAG: hypothetical protein QXL15_01285 [Candidatus Korarchaeota archaeon]